MSVEGYLSILLHAHLPFVRHPEHERFLEEDWLYEAITESYLPLLAMMETLARDKVPFRLTLVLTPTLLSMWADSLLMERYTRHLDRMIDLARLEVERTRDREEFHTLAQFYLNRFLWAKRTLCEQRQGDLIGAFRDLEDLGNLEILTCAATHAYLPLLTPFPEAISAQVEIAVQEHLRFLGRKPRGIWLPECGYTWDVEKILARPGLSYFFVDTHGLMLADPQPIYGPYAPMLTAAGPAVFGRDRWTTRQVWSSQDGYPGDSEYREYYRDIGYDLDLEYLRPFIQPTGDRKNTGFKYFRITGQTDRKEVYRPERAVGKARQHAEHFVAERVFQCQTLQQALGGKAPIIVCPYDAELFGHWWFEGPWFLEFVFRKLAALSIGVQAITPAEYLSAHPTHQVGTPAPSSWGQLGYSQMWLNETNDWIYPHLHWSTGRMIELARAHPEASGLTRRCLDQMARELMLAQSSDWAFIMKTGTMVDYAVRRTREHLVAFRALHQELLSDQISETELARLEQAHNLFPTLDYRIYR